MKYLKYRWNESPGTPRDNWGGSWWYFEIGPDGYPVRQVEEYDAGFRLRYGPDHSEDEFGTLSYGHELDMDRSADQVLSATEFEAVWSTGHWHNKPTKPGTAAEGRGT